MTSKILLIRTHKNLKAGGPVPPLGLLYVASSIVRVFGEKYELKVFNTGLDNLSFDKIKKEIRTYQPYIVGMSTMTCEADLMRGIASCIKEIKKDTSVVVGGPHATLAKEFLLEDENIDFGVIGEGEVTLTELLAELEGSRDFSKIDGLVYRSGNRVFLNKTRALIADLDYFSVLPSVWDLINFKEYSRHNNWNGICKQKFYIPVVTSRGCPFCCMFCTSRSIFGSHFRARSPENILSELAFLSEKYRVKEIHIFDDVFNFDIERACKICSLIMASNMRLSLAFPNGLRIDRMNDQLIQLLSGAGTYKIHYGIETVTARLQKIINKNLNISDIKEIVDKTVRAGIITAGYFILGLPSETRGEMTETISFAVKSNLDNAYFFKFTDFSNIDFDRNRAELTRENKDVHTAFRDYHFFAAESSATTKSADELNTLILEAQQQFYLNSRRLLRSILRAPRRLLYLKNLMIALAIILQSYLTMKLTESKSNKKNS